MSKDEIQLREEVSPVCSNCKSPLIHDGIWCSQDCESEYLRKKIIRLQAEKNALENWLKLNEFEPDNYSKKPRMIEKMIKVSTVIKKLKEQEEQRG